MCYTCMSMGPRSSFFIGLKVDFLRNGCPFLHPKLEQMPTLPPLLRFSGQGKAEWLPRKDSCRVVPPLAEDLAETRGGKGPK